MVNRGSRKIGCRAHIVIKECVLYPEYKIDHDEKKFAVRTLKMRLMKELRVSEIVADGIIDIPQVWSTMSCMTCAKTTHPTQ